MEQVAYAEAYAFNPVSGMFDIWIGTATLAAIGKAGLHADLSHLYYDDESAGGKDGWACMGPATLIPRPSGLFVERPEQKQDS